MGRSSGGMPDLDVALAELGTRGLNSVFVEGGAHLAGGASARRAGRSAGMDVRRRPCWAAHRLRRRGAPSGVDAPDHDAAFSRRLPHAPPRRRSLAKSWNAFPPGPTPRPQTDEKSQMFTGIVTDVRPGRGGDAGGVTRVVLSTPVRPRHSSTSAPRSPTTAAADRGGERQRSLCPSRYRPETLDKTTLGGWTGWARRSTGAIAEARRRAGRPPRLRPCRAAWRPSSRPAPDGDSTRFRGRRRGRGRRNDCPQRARSRLTACRLTVNEVGPGDAAAPCGFGVNVIPPHPGPHTTFRRWPPATGVNFSRSTCWPAMSRGWRRSPMGRTVDRQRLRLHFPDRRDHRGGAQGPHVHPGRRRGPGKRRRPRDSGCDGRRRPVNFMAKNMAAA